MRQLGVFWGFIGQLHINQSRQPKLVIQTQHFTNHSSVHEYFCIDDAVENAK